MRGEAERTDVLTPEQRRLNMSRIRGKDTKPELQVRRVLHGRGFRYRLHVASLPGKPDLVLPRYRAVILIHGCFWHGHDCPLFKWPKSNTDFWRKKIEGNVKRDVITLTALQNAGWRTMIFWECALRGRGHPPNEVIFMHLEQWLRSNEKYAELRNPDYSTSSVILTLAEPEA